MHSQQKIGHNIAGRGKSTATAFVICLALFGLPGIACFVQGDVVTGIAILTVGLSCFLGYRVGALRALAVLIGVVAAYCFAPVITTVLEPWVTESTGMTEFASRLVCLAVIGLVLVFGCSFIGSLVSRKCFAEGSSMYHLNGCGGSLFFGAETAVGIVVLLGGLMILFPNSRSHNTPDESASHQEKMQHQFTSVASTIRESAIGKFIQDQELAKKFPQIEKLKEIQSAVRSNDASMMERFTRIP